MPGCPISVLWLVKVGSKPFEGNEQRRKVMFGVFNKDRSYTAFVYDTISDGRAKNIDMFCCTARRFVLQATHNFEHHWMNEFGHASKHNWFSSMIPSLLMAAFCLGYTLLVNVFPPT